MNKEWFIQKYTDLHEDLNALEREIAYHEKNRESLVDSDYKIVNLRRKTLETIELLEKTREDERKIFNYEK
jgi:hypothetical protein